MNLKQEHNENGKMKKYISLGDSRFIVELSTVKDIYPTNQLLSPTIPCIAIDFKNGKRQRVQYSTEENRDSELKYLQSAMEEIRE